MIHKILLGIIKGIQIVGITILSAIILAGLFIGGISLYITESTKDQIYNIQAIEGPYDYGIVLGASVYGLKLSPILQDRIEIAILLYREGKIKNIIISGDSGKPFYNEVTSMRTYLLNRGIPEEHIFEDHSGINTFSSIVNANLTKPENKYILITQAFHLPRALYIANGIGLNAIGVISDRASYNDINEYTKRERLAGIKAFLDLTMYKLGIYD